MNTTRKIAVSLMAASFLGATALPVMAQQNTTPQTPKMEKRMAHAGQGKRGGGKRHGMRNMRRAFERYDTNKDGVITQDEVDAAVIARFNDIAGDDGTITLEQYRAAWMERSLQPRVRAFQRLDRDGDGNVTREEFDLASERMFTRLDRDGNGELTRPAPDQSAGQKKDRGKGAMRGSRRGGGRVMELMERFDLDKDGKITRAEFDAVRAEAFGEADADGNTSITLEEFATIWQDLNGNRMTRGFQRLDSDGDLKVTQEEYSARSKNFVEKNDRNGDGVVTKADRGGKHKGKKGHRSMKQKGQKGEPRKAGAQDTKSGSARKIDI